MCRVMKRCILLFITVLTIKTDAGLTNFETSSRDWFNDLFRDDLDWKLHRGQLTNRHGRGSYIYLTSSTDNGKSAILESRILRTPGRGSCVSFWYRISGKNAGVLKLKRMEMTGTKIRTRELWLREGDQGRAWNFARVSVPSNPHTRYYQIIMESKLGRGGVVALDDIDLNANNPCSNSLENGGFVVDFETKVTAMKNKRYGDHFDWVITKSGALSSGTGPVHDVTSGVGHYLHLITKGKASGQRASYGSNPVPASTNGACLSFYYYMHGDGVGKLTVSILRRSGWVSTAKTVWSKTGSNDGGWHLARISLANSLTMQRYDVMFTGIVGKGASGNIALDDITLINSECLVVSNVSTAHSKKMDREVPPSRDGQVGKKFSVEACNILWELRKSGQLCDAVIRVENTEFPIHRNIMSACSPYFRTLFTNELFDTNTREVVIPGVSAEIMSHLIDYAYTRDAAVTAENVEFLLPAADQFHVLGLVKLCCDFLISELSPENCIGIRRFAKTYFCHNLERAAFRFLMLNIADVLVYSNEYLQLGIGELCDILSSDELNVRNEELVFDAVLRWIDFDTESRRDHIARLLKTIRLGLLTTQYFVEKVKVHPYIKDNDSCKPIIIETLKFLYDLDMDEDKELDLNNPLARPRVPHEILFVIGGWSGGSPTNIVETYDTRADRWIVCDAVDSGPRAYHGTSTIDHIVYIIGGFDGVEYFNSVRSFNPMTKEWKEKAPMNAKRCYVSTTVLGEFIYAMGGYDGQVRQNTVERYLPSKNQWSLIASMHNRRSDASATSLDGKVYICGGFNGHECLSTAESYDPVTNQWTLLEPMRNRRSGIGVIAYKDEIYALGGFNGITRMNTGEKYCPKANRWKTIPEMFNPRSNFAIEVIDEMVFAIGGFNGVTTIFNVECFDASTDEWYDATDMNLNRSALSACVVKELPSVQDYIHKER